MAYHLVQTLRYQLKAKGVHDSWQTIRRTMENQQRITVVLQREDEKKSTSGKPLRRNLNNRSFTKCWGSQHSTAALKKRCFSSTNRSHKNINL